MWWWLKLVNLFLILLLAVKISSDNNAENVVWIEDDVYDHWYRALDIFGSSLIVKVAKILVDGEAAIATVQKDK